MRAGPEWFIWIETLGLISFAVNALIVAEARKLSLLGLFLCAVLTALGGGTLRDILLGPAAQPFFWAAYPFYIVAVFALTLAYGLISPVRALIARRDVLIKETAELVAMASFGALGAAKTVNLMLPSAGGDLLSLIHVWVLAAFFGAVSAAFGGLIRDVILNEFPSVLKPRVWVLEPVFIGSGVLALLRILGMAPAWAMLFGFLTILAIRAVVVMGAYRPKAAAAAGPQ